MYNLSVPVSRALLPPSVVHIAHCTLHASTQIRSECAAHLFGNKWVSLLAKGHTMFEMMGFLHVKCSLESNRLRVASVEQFVEVDSAFIAIYSISFSMTFFKRSANKITIKACRQFSGANLCRYRKFAQFDQT